MKKIVLWGTGKACRSYDVLIADLQKREILSVVGHVLSLEEEQGSFPKLEKKQLKELEFDKILVATNLPEVENARKEILELGIPEEKISSLASCLFEIESDEGVHKNIVKNQLMVLEEVLNATEEEISDLEWMKRTISKFGVYPFDTQGDITRNWTHYGLMQMLDEFTALCCDLAKLEDINKAIEIGVYRGRSSYFMCAVLSRRNKNLKYRCVDICDNLDCFEEYAKVLPALEKCIPSTSDNYKGEEYDFVFIDGEHTYDGSILDYYNLGQYAKKVVCFHDIYGHEYDHENGGTVRSWSEIKEINKDQKIKIYSIYPEKWMGIGSIWK